MAVLTPHFDLPFRFRRGTAAVVEQDSYEDVFNCAEAILRTEQGTRLYDDRAGFGIVPPEFENQPVDITLMRETVMDQEPRADLLITEEHNVLDLLADKIRIEIWPTSDSL